MFESEERLFDLAEPVRQVAAEHRRKNSIFDVGDETQQRQEKRRQHVVASQELLRHLSPAVTVVVRPTEQRVKVVRMPDIACEMMWVAE